jgi:hypothetical protein
MKVEDSQMNLSVLYSELYYLSYPNKIEQVLQAMFKAYREWRIARTNALAR